MPDDLPERNPLSFHWAEPVWKQRGLGFWAFIVLLGLAAFFYLFQVVYPQAQRFTPVPHQIVALNPTDPAVKELMNRVQDCDFLILPPTDSTGAISLEEHAPVFHPSFEGHRLQLQDLPNKAFTVPPARLLQMDAPVLPPQDFSELKPNAISPAVKSMVTLPRIELRLSGPLSLRGIKRPVDLSGITLVDPSGCRFQLGVNADGSVDVALPLASTEDTETLQKVTAALQALRFTPASVKSSSPVWGTASFEWTPGGTP